MRIDFESHCVQPKKRKRVPQSGVLFPKRCMNPKCPCPEKVLRTGKKHYDIKPLVTTKACQTILTAAKIQNYHYMSTQIENEDLIAKRVFCA